MIRGSVALIRSSNMLGGVVVLCSGHTWGTGGSLLRAIPARGVSLLLGNDRPWKEYRHH